MKLNSKKFRMSRGRVFVLYLSLLVHFLVGVGSAVGGVFCFKTDGHVAVEHAAGSDCCSSSHSAERGPVSISSSNLGKSCCSSSSSTAQAPLKLLSSLKHTYMGNHCRMCLEISALIGRINQDSAIVQNPLSPPRSVLVVFSFPMPVSQEISRDTFLSQPLSPHTLALRRSVVLLI